MEVWPVRVFTVSELTSRIRDLLEGEFYEIWVEGEISNLRSPRTGHLYFTLKDDRSQIRAVLFKLQRRYLKFDLEDGQQVICWGRVGVYEKRGEYQLIVDYVEPKGIGALQVAFEQLKERLASEGLFDEERKRPLPLLPRRIGIVTSPTGAVIRDMLQILRRRFENVEVLLYPVKVQGEGAAEEIAEGVTYLSERGDVDVIIVARGGGSLEDLWAFNEEVVARSIYRSRVPVISAVGHETDYTIADFVADLRAPTPSAAAELVVRRKEELRERLSASVRRMEVAIKGTFEVKGERLKGLEGKVMAYNPVVRISSLYDEMKKKLKRLEACIEKTLEAKSSRLREQMGKLDALSPMAVLARGYSITWRLPERRIVREGKEVEVGDLVEVTLAKGGMRCGVKERW
ncbi:MAG: exodeoxyribonuclease VII large subunit [Deltaproteobacteria bacterium]|nr:MAG: exodeoxyribonuclease VII large subunit [Deltaproteobacteria bacterium]